jgi:hypothetical protein
MIRKLIHLPETLDQHISLLAKHEHKSAAQVIRELVKDGLRSKHGNAGEGLLKLTTLGLQGTPTSSRDIDKTLYEDTDTDHH